MLSKIKPRYVILFLIFAAGAWYLIHLFTAEPKFSRTYQRKWLGYYLVDRTEPHYGTGILYIHDTVTLDPDGNPWKKFRDTTFYIYQEDPIYIDSAGVKKVKLDSATHRPFVEFHSYPLAKQFIHSIEPIFNEVPPGRFSPDQRVDLDITKIH